MATEENISKEVLASVQDAVGRQVKLSLKKKVQLEAKGESRILALASHRAFLLTARVPARIEQSLHFFDIQAISSSKPGQLIVDYDKGQMSIKLSSNEEVDEVITVMGVSIQEHCPGLDPLRVIKKLALKPTDRLSSLQEFWKNYVPSDAAPCGAFSRMYWCVCDQMGLPYRAEVQWDVDTIYLTQDTRELNLQDFIHLETRDLVGITAVLEFNQWFTKLSLKDYKLSTDLSDQIVRVLARSSRLEELALENTGLKADFAQKLAGALNQNPHSALRSLNLASNSVEDKGIATLSSSLGKLPSGLKHLNLSKNSLSAKGVNILSQSLCSNPTIFNTLTHLDLSGNTLRGDDLSNLWNFLGQPNNLHTLDLSNSDCPLDLVCSSLSRGCLKHLSVLRVSKSVFTIKRGKELPGSFKQFFSSALALNTIVFSGTRFPPEALKALLLGLACNPNLKDVTLDLSSCELRSAGSQILEGCIAEIPNVSSLDISDNGLDCDLTTLLVWLAKNRSIRELCLGKNFNNIKSKNLGQVLNSLVLMIQEEESPLTSLSLADSKLKADLSMVLNAVGGNSSLKYLDISGNAMGDMGAKMLAKALQINTKLRTVIWDRNNISAQGLQDVAAALEKNYTIRFMPVPIMDAAQALRSNPEKTEDALMKMEHYLLRNHETRKYLQEQAYRLQQGIVTSTTQQMIDRLCVKVQDHLNSLRFNEHEKVQEDMKVAERLVQDARNSKRLLANMYHLCSSWRGSAGGDAGAGAGGNEGGASESSWVTPIHEKLESMAGEVSTVIDSQLQNLLDSMMDTAESVCPHVMHRANLRPALLRASEGKMTVPQSFITNTLLEQSAVDIINKISDVKLSMASFLSDRIIDEILDSLSRSHHTLAEHLSRRGKPLLHRDSEEAEVVDERQLEADGLPPPPSDLLLTPTSKRQSILFRMVRPISVAFELEFDLDKALQHVPIHMEDLPLPPPPEAVGAESERPESFTDLLESESPKLQHVTKQRPRRKKFSRSIKSPPVKAAVAEDAEQSELVGKVDEGIDDFFTKKVTKLGVRRTSGRDSAVEVEKKRESRMSGFFNLIKSRTSIKSPPTSPHTAPTPTVLPNTAPIITPTIMESDEVDSITKSPASEVVPEPLRTPVTEGSEPVEHVDLTVAPKPNVEEGKKRDGPPLPKVRGVQVMGNDFLAQLRAKQEKIKEKVGDSSSSANKAEPDPEEGETGSLEKPELKDHHTPPTLLKTAHTPAAKQVPVATHSGLKASVSPACSSKTTDHPSNTEPRPKPRLPRSPLSRANTPPDDDFVRNSAATSPKLPVNHLHPKPSIHETETEQPSPRQHSLEDVFPPPIVEECAEEGSASEPDHMTPPQPPVAAQRSVSLHTPTTPPEESEDQPGCMPRPAQVEVLTPTHPGGSPCSTGTRLQSTPTVPHADQTLEQQPTDDEEEDEV